MKLTNKIIAKFNTGPRELTDDQLQVRISLEFGVRLLNRKPLLMSGIGQKQTLGSAGLMSAIGGKADIPARLSNVCF